MQKGGQTEWRRRRRRVWESRIWMWLCGLGHHRRRRRRSPSRRRSLRFGNGGGYVGLFLLLLRQGKSSPGETPSSLLSVGLVLL